VTDDGDSASAWRGGFFGASMWLGAAALPTMLVGTALTNVPGGGACRVSSDWAVKKRGWLAVGRNG